MKGVWNIPCVILLLSAAVTAAGQTLTPDLRLNSRNGLDQNTVWSMAEDSLGRMWLGMPGGVQVYNGSEILETALDEGIFHLCATRDFVYGRTNNAVVRFDVETLKMKAWPSDTTIGSLALNPDGKLRVVLGADSILLLNGALEPQTSWKSTSIEEERLDTLYVGPHPVCTDYKSVWIPGRQDSILHVSVVNVWHQLTPNRLVYNSNQGMIEVRYTNGSLQTLTHFPEERIERIHIDRARNLWVSTAGDGVYRLQAAHWQTDYYPVLSASGKRVACWSFLEVDGQLYNATSQGLYPLEVDVRGLAQATAGRFTISGAANASLVLIGTASDGLLRWRQGRMETVYHNPDLPSDNTVVSVIQLASGFLAATKNHLLWLDDSGDVVKKKTYVEAGINVYAMHIRPSGDGYLMGSVRGVYRLDADFELVETYDAGNIHVSSMVVETDSGLVVVSMNDGLLHQTEEGFRSVGLPGKQLFGIERTEDALWISGVGGMFRYTSEGIWKLGPEEGIPLDEYNQCGAFLREDGMLYTAGVGGILATNTNSLRPGTAWPTVRLIQGERRVQGSLQPINYDQAEVLVNLEYIDALVPSGFVTRAIHGSDTSLVRQSMDLLLHVPYGDSQVVIETVRTRDGAVRSQSIQVQRAFPFWTAWWFWALMAVLVVALGLGIYSLVRFLQTRRLLRSEQAEKRMTEERLRISRELHDNIGARLTHIISSLDVEMYQRKKGGESLSNINAFARQTMSQLRETIWAVSDRTVFFSEFATRVEQYAAESRSLTGVAVRVSNRVQGDFELNPVQTINFFRILQEAINNSLKYAEATQIDIVLQTIGDQQIRMEMVDDGVGFDAENHRHGTGVQGMRARSQEAGATFALRSAPGEGTHICVEFRHE